MIKGGYKVIDFYGIHLTDSPVNIPGTYSAIQKNFEKMLILSGVSSDDYLFDDNVGFCTINDDDAFEIQFGNQKITVYEDDDVTMLPSGGGGSSDYNDLTNKPKINDISLIGNKTYSELGIQAAEQGKGLTSNDFTNALKNKLDGIEAGADVNVQSDWDQDDNTKDDFIKNKPTIPEVKDNLSELDDVQIFNPQEDDALLFNSSNNSWDNKPVEKKHKIVQGTLEAGETQITLTDSAIKNDSFISIYTDNYSAPTSVSGTVGSVTLSFNVQTVDVLVSIEIQ